MAKTGIRMVNRGAHDLINSIESNVKDYRELFTRVLYPMYQDAQRNRWMTENSSEGSKWKAITPSYAAYKLRRYGGGIKYKWVGGRGTQETRWFDKKGNRRPWQESGTWPSYPGAGKLLMIATGDLQKSVIGPGKGHRKLITPRSMSIFTTIPYAADANKARPFMTFSPAFKAKMKQKIKEYVMARNK